MTVATSVSKSGPYAGAGTAGPFTVGFRFLDATHLEVIKTTAAGDVTLTYPGDYTVAGVGNPTGSVTTTVAVAFGEKLTIIRNVPFTQEADYVQNDDFPAESHENALDKLTMAVQQVAELAGRSLALPASAPAGASTELPSPQANALIGWTPAADALQNVDPTTLATIITYGSANADTFSGTGAQKDFPLTANPGALANMDVAIAGVTQRPNIDFTWAGGTTISFLTAPPVGVNNILVRYMQALPQGAADIAASGLYGQSGASLFQSNVNRVVDTVAQLRVLDRTRFNRAFVLGYYAAGDGGGGNYYYDAADTTSADDGGSVIIATDGGRWKLLAGAVVSVAQFGAKGDYNGTTGTDDTTPIQNTIKFAAQGVANNNWFFYLSYGKPRVVDFPSRAYKVAGKLLTPSAVHLRGNNATLVGTGYTATDNICFETAYFNAGVLTSNIGTAAESQRVQYTIIEGFKFLNFQLALNLYDFVEGCRVADCAISDCYQSFIADRCFYAQFDNVTYRNNFAPANAAPCFDFRNFVNVEKLEGLRCTGRTLAFQFNGGINGLMIRNCSAESCVNGMKFLGEVNPLVITTNYFEGITGIALDFSAASAHRSVNIDDNWFNNVSGTCLTGVQMTGGKFGRGNYFVGTIGTKVSIADNVSTIKVEIPPVRIASNAASLKPALPAGYTFGAAVQVDFPVQIYDAGTGNTSVQSVFNAGLMALPFGGNQGWQPGKVAFCDTSTTGTTTMTGFIDSTITFSGYPIAAYMLNITDNAGTYFLAGLIFGGAVAELKTAAGKTVTSINNGGNLRLQITGLTHPSGVMGAEGIVRLL